MLLNRIFGGRAAPAVAALPPETFVQRNTQFACDLHARLKGRPGNLFFSPLSISTALAMVYAGARGQTATQMRQVLHFPPDQSALHAAFGDLQRRLLAAGESRVVSVPSRLRAGRGRHGPVEYTVSSGLEFALANALWAQAGHPFLSPFRQVASRDYQAQIEQVDFGTQADAAISAINRWVAEKTRDRIQNILPSGSLNAATRLVLANAIYFKGAWAEPFRETDTATQPFHLATFRKTEVRLMHQTAEVNYTANQDLQAVELPYGGGQFSMVILLPRRVDGCARLEGQLGPSLLAATLVPMKRQAVEIFLPRFKIESAFDFGDTLPEMGMPDVFSGSADLSGMDGAHSLFLSNVFHKAWGEVNEKGTEAAATTVPALLAMCMEEPPPISPPVFRADRPFLFLIRDTQSGAILFVGRLTDPGNS